MEKDKTEYNSHTVHNNFQIIKDLDVKKKMK